MPHGPPPVNRRDRHPARVTQLERNARIAQLGRGGRHRRGGRPGYRQRPNAAAGFPMPSPRGATPASRRDRRPAQNIQPGRNARIAQLDVGRRHRRGARPGHRRRSNTATGFPTPSPRGPSPASRRDRRPARNIQLERNARIAQLERGGRHRRGRRPGHRRRSNTAAGFPMPSPRGPPPASRRDRRPARNHSQGAMHALRSSTSAAATVAAPGLATAGARTPATGFPMPSPRRPPPANRRDRRPARNASQGAMHALRGSTSAAATVAAPALATASARTPPPVVPRRRRAGRRPRILATDAPRGTPARAQCTHCAAPRRPPPPSRRPPWPPPALEHHHRFSRAVAAMGRPATSGARRPIAEHPARCAARAAHDHRWRPPPSRPPNPAPLRLPQRSRSSLRPRTVVPSTESAHRGRFPT